LWGVSWRAPKGRGLHEVGVGLVVGCTSRAGQIVTFVWWASAAVGLGCVSYTRSAVMTDKGVAYGRVGSEHRGGPSCGCRSLAVWGGRGGSRFSERCRVE